MPKLIALISSFLFFMSNNFVSTARQLPGETLYPWKSKSGLIGYSDQHGHLKISPGFENASLFINRFAVVTKDGKDGVVDEKGVLKMPCDYDRVQLVGVGTETLAITSRKFNGWWRINQWKLFPGFSVLGSSRDRRVFDTDVPRIKWEIILLSNNQTLISSDHQPDEYPYNSYNIQGFDNKILIHDQLYGITNGKARHISGGIKEILRDHKLLRQNGNVYEIIDSNLNPLEHAIFRIPEEVSIKVNGNPQLLKTVKMLFGSEMKLNFMQDQQGAVFSAPDFTKPFPKEIKTYFDSHVDATAILSNAYMISAVPETDYFLIYSLVNEQQEFYILNKNGNWEADRSKTKDFVVISNSGDVVYPSLNDFGLKDHLPADFKVERIDQTVASKHWFAISGTMKRDGSSRAGIFDAGNKKWVLPVKYSSLGEMTGYPYIWKFELENESDYKKKKYGLIDINTGRIIVNPRYTTLNPDAKAGISTGAAWDEFYINPATGKEYREL